jgi:antitoxin component of MazEF toxin-antitoxin module
MRDTILITESGGTLGFIIQSHIIGGLELDIGDLVEIEIFKPIGDKQSYTMTRQVRWVGSSRGVSIRYFVAEKLELEAGDVVEVDIRKV